MCSDNHSLDIFDKYIIQGEPEKQGRAANWKIAIGLQDVDGLTPSGYLLANAEKHINGKMSIQDVENSIREYYRVREERDEPRTGEMEADKVSTQITRILGAEGFSLSPTELQNIHRVLFCGVYAHAGKFRDYNFTKKEYVLNGESVIYSSFENIYDTLVFDFTEERKYSYKGKSKEDAARRIARFISGLWQIHPFCEGNTRTIAVFTIKYLRKFGFSISNECFAKNSWYFRNALVRANYDHIPLGIASDYSYLDNFFENLLFAAEHELKNRYLIIDPDMTGRM